MPYVLLDERTKKSNRDSLREAIRTLVGYGYDIDPPDQEGKSPWIRLLGEPVSALPVGFVSLGAHVVVDETIETTRLFRVEQTYAVKTGKWYFEFEAITGGDMRVGWARPGCRPDVELGADEQVFVFDGYRVSERLLCRPTELQPLTGVLFSLSGPAHARGKPLLRTPLEKGRRGRLHDQHGGQVHDFHPERRAPHHQQGLGALLH